MCAGASWGIRRRYGGSQLRRGGIQGGSGCVQPSGAGSCAGSSHRNRNGDGRRRSWCVPLSFAGPAPVTPSARAGTAPGVRPEAVRLRPVSARRRPVLVLGSALVVVASSAVVAVSFQHAGRTTPVLAASEALSAGALVEPSDLRVVDVHVPGGVPVVPASGASSLVGRQASTAVPAGSLLAPSDVAGAYAPSRGYAVVGVAVTASQMPAGGVAAGEEIDVVVTTPAGSQVAASAPASNGSPVGTDLPMGAVSAEQPGSVVVGGVPVLSVATPAPASSATGDVVVSVLVPVLDAPTVADLSAAGDLAVVIVAPGL